MTLYICSHCGYQSASWMGKCPQCNEWNTFTEQQTEKKGKKQIQTLDMTSFDKISSAETSRTKTGIHEFDRVLGGGIVPGAAMLLTGEPGVGKSTLLLQSLQHLRTLYISGEESAEQVKTRAERLGADLSKMFFSGTLQVEGIIRGIQENKEQFDIVVIDSIQTIYSANVESPLGSVSQLKETTNAIISLAKQLNVPIIIVGHITKDGDIAGPKTLEHMVDVVFTFEGERMNQFRVLRARKNRFGSTDEIGIFEMVKDGLQEVNNPLAFLEDHTERISGKAVVGIVEGYRNLFFEVQALASPTSLAMPRRVVKGIDYNKFLLLLAVLRKNVNLSFDGFDMYVNVIGGIDIKSPAADLGIVAAIISSVKNIPLDMHTLFVGEVGLLGEVRKVFGQDKMIEEAKRLSFHTVHSPKTIKSVKDIYGVMGKW